MPTENPEMPTKPEEQRVAPPDRAEAVAKPLEAAPPLAERPQAGPLRALPAQDEPPGRWVRIGLLAIGGMLACVFALAFYLNPYQDDGAPRTMATHTKLGLPPCNFVVMTGKPCPSCGMTTSFALLVRGDLAASLRANWVGTILAAAWAMLMVWCVACAAANRFLLIPEGRGELVLTCAVGGFLVLMLGRWIALLASG